MYLAKYDQFIVLSSDDDDDDETLKDAKQKSNEPKCEAWHCLVLLVKGYGLFHCQRSNVGAMSLILML